VWERHLVSNHRASLLMCSVRNATGATFLYMARRNCQERTYDAPKEVLLAFGPNPKLSDLIELAKEATGNTMLWSPLDWHASRRLWDSHTRAHTHIHTLIHTHDSDGERRGRYRKSMPASNLYDGHLCVVSVNRYR
jgi:hypothetical protein